MKKILSIVLIASLMVSGMVVKANAAAFDDFNITVTVTASINILLKELGGANYTTWAITPDKDVNIPTTMLSAEGIWVDSTSTNPVDLRAAAGNSTSGWVPSSDAIAGNEEYVLQLKGFAAAGDPGDMSAATVIPGGGGAEFESTEFSAVQDRWVYARFTTPTATAFGGVAQTINVVITATVD